MRGREKIFWMSIPLLCGALTLSGCSAGQPPTAAVAQAQLAVQQATTGKAAVHAPVETRNAQEKLNGAQRAIDDEEYDLARRLAEQALIDAQLAQAKAAAAEEQQNAQEVRKTMDALQNEATRPTVR